MKKFVESLRRMPRSREERLVEWRVAMAMMTTAAFLAGMAVMAAAAAFWGWRP